MEQDKTTTTPDAGQIQQSGSASNQATAGPGGVLGSLMPQLRQVGYDAGSALVSPQKDQGLTAQGGGAPGTAAEKTKPEESKKFGNVDPKGQLATLYPGFRTQVEALITNAHNAGLNIWICEGLRSIDRQNELYAQGRTKPGNIVTNAKGGSSFHNYGLAVDVVFYGGTGPWDNAHPWSKLGQAGRDAGLKWLGDMGDRPHFEQTGHTVKQLYAWYQEGGNLDYVWQKVGGGAAGQSKPTTGPSADEKTENQTATSKQASYTVARGDSLWTIAQRFLGDGNKWRVIADANKISNPNQLRVGQVLTIPGSSLTTESDPSSTPSTGGPSHSDQPAAPSAPKPETGKPEGGATGGTSGTGTSASRTYVVTDPDALIRSAPPALAPQKGQKVPVGKKVRVVESFLKDKEEYALVEEVQEQNASTPAKRWGWTKISNLGGFERTHGSQDKDVDLSMAPDDAIPLTNLGELARSMAIIYNTRGKYLQAKAKELGIDVSSAAAVLQIESGGQGFGDSGQMIIRFENHIFHSYWGKSNSQKFAQHFQYNAAEPWKGHKFRADAKGEWRACHAGQGMEWEVFDFARSLGDNAAIQSISMGTAQVMGFNYKTLGYATPEEMFKAMNGGIRPQVDGMFEYIRKVASCINGLKEKNYVKFATGYNGAGKAASYAAQIKSAADSFANVAKGRKYGPPKA